MQQREIRISETETKYLLFIPIYQKERAKGISGRRWDREQKCWVYPRNIRMYKALIEEFGDDLTPSSSFTPPQPFDESDPFDEPGSQGDKQESELQKEITQLLQILSAKKGEIELLKDQRHEKERENEKLKKQIAQLQAGTKEPSPDTTTVFINSIKDIAVKATGDDPVFGEYFRTLAINEDLPIELGRWLETQLKNTLNSSERLFDLIQQCEDAEIFDRNDISLAHVIRGQRNLILHDSTIDERMKMGRALYCLFAAALLAPKLPEP